MSGIHDFYQSIHTTGAYASPPGSLRDPPLRGGIWAGMRFYFGGIGGVIAQGNRAIRDRSFSMETLGQLSWSLVHCAETMGTPVSFEGFESMGMIDKQPAVIVANHMSMVETMLLPAGVFANGPMVIVAKRSLTKYPGFGRILEASQPIFVDRANPRQDLADVLEQGVRRLKEGSSILLFPQGTRLAVFDPHRFNSLGAKLAKRAGVPLIPVACKTDFSKPGRLFRDLGPVDPALPIRFAAGPLLDSARPQRELQEACTGHIIRFLKQWHMPVVDAAAGVEEDARDG